MRKILYVSGILLLVFGCSPAENKQKDALNYFDLKGYFEHEAARLTKSNPVFTKTVVVNDAAETKKIRLGDWKKELAVFSDVDMNRNAWKGLFQVKKTAEQELFSSDHEKVPVKEVLIIKRNNKVYGIRILVKNSNVLYSSSDTLSYYPDSLYQVKKKQHIKLLSEKNYSITGMFK
jgi:hypothetical protein